MNVIIRHFYQDYKKWNKASAKASLEEQPAPIKSQIVETNTRSRTRSPKTLKRFLAKEYNTWLKQ